MAETILRSLAGQRACDHSSLAGFHARDGRTARWRQHEREHQLTGRAPFFRELMRAWLFRTLRGRAGI